MIFAVSFDLHKNVKHINRSRIKESTSEPVMITFLRKSSETFAKNHLIAHRQIIP